MKKSKNLEFFEDVAGPHELTNFSMLPGGPGQAPPRNGPAPGPGPVVTPPVVTPVVTPVAPAPQISCVDTFPECAVCQPIDPPFA